MRNTASVRRILVCLASASFLLAQGPPSGSRGATRLLVQKTRNATHGAALDALAKNGTAMVRQLPELDVYVVSLPAAAAQGVMHKLENSGLFTFAEVEGTGKGGAIPN